MAAAKSRRRFRWRWLILALCTPFLALFLVVGLAFAGKPFSPMAGPIPIEIKAIPIDFDSSDPARRDFGKLVWRRGLALYSDARHFGGYSSVEIDPSGTHIVAISDAGSWLRAELDYDGRYLKGLRRATIGPLLDTDGKPIASFRRRDAEGFTLKSGTLQKGEGYISFENEHRIALYPFDRKSFGPPTGTLPLPKNTLSGNAGIEAIAYFKDAPMQGALLAFPQEEHNKSGDLIGWLIGGPNPGTLSVKDIGGYTITGMTVLPGGDVVILERRLSFREGMQMRIRRLARADLKPGAVLTGEILLEAPQAFNIDNMEAIAAHKAADGQTILTIMSDDNFLGLQRNLIMQFALKEER